MILRTFKTHQLYLCQTAVLAQLEFFADIDHRPLLISCVGFALIAVILILIHSILVVGK